jgi:uncharacterized protein
MDTPSPSPDAAVSTTLPSISAAPPPLAPRGAAERIRSIDTLRGVAVLGILLINILSFGLPSAADGDPTVYGGASGVNLAYWLVNQVLFEGKMRTLFSMLFGASVVLFTSRVSRLSEGEDFADIYYRRTLWLAAFGVLHSTFLWEGDILLSYGSAGIVLFLFRKVRPWRLLLLGLVCLALGMALKLGEILETQALRPRVLAAREARDAGQPLTEEQEADLKSWQDKLKEAWATDEEVQKEIEAKRGTYADVFAYRSALLTSSQASAFYRKEFLDVLGMMLVGMALFKWGIFSAERSMAFYVTLALLSYGVGVPLNAYVGYRLVEDRFEMGSPAQLWSWASYEVGRLSVALGHVGMVMLLYKADRLPRLRQGLASVGQMALTNYLLQTVLCTSFFYGYGLGWFAYLERAELLAVVAAVWALELTWSPLWLRCFQFGPVEWLWRWLSYCRRPPLWRTA